ncbi:MAG: hypothetical protein AAB439_02375 [Patescibacteria group bacterium]
MFEGVRSEYLESVADDTFGILFLLTLGATGLGAVYGGGKAIAAAGKAVGGKK